jgi:hypothetical protein
MSQIVTNYIEFIIKSKEKSDHEKGTIPSLIA